MRNACALIALPYRSPISGGRRTVSIIQEERAGRGGHVDGGRRIHKHVVRNPQADTTTMTATTTNIIRHPSQDSEGYYSTAPSTAALPHAQQYVAYKLNHFTCSLAPTVSCSKLDYTRPGHPSDAPPFVTAQQDDVEANMMLTRLVIPNTAATSIRSADHHRLCMALARDRGGVGDSLSIAHQYLGLDDRGGGSLCSSGSYERRQRSTANIP